MARGATGLLALLLCAGVAPAPAQVEVYVWGLTLGGGARRVVNGAYIVVVEVDGQRYRHRLYVARPSP